jgi:hypothetical protein
VLNLEFGYVSFVDDFVLDGLLESAGALLHIDALLEEQVWLLEVGAHLLHGGCITSPS